MKIAQPEIPLFSFGTLMDHDVLTLVSGQPISELDIIPATASGFSQVKILTENFPVMVTTSGAVTDGVLITGLTGKSLQRILFFEGDEYELSDIMITTRDGQEIKCQYFRDSGIYELDTTQWDFDQWVANDKSNFLLRTEQYMNHFGAMSATEADKFW